MRPDEYWFEDVHRLAQEHRCLDLNDHGDTMRIIKRELALEKQAKQFGFRVRLSWDQKEQGYHIVGLLG